MRSSRAFTMIELLVALGLFAVALLATLAAVGAGGQLRQSSRETELATEILADRLERYQALGRSPTAWQQALVGQCFADAAFSDDRLPGVTGTVVVLDEAEAAATFAVDEDGLPGPDPLDLDDDGTAGEAGVTSGAGAAIHASWNAGKVAPFGSDVTAYSVVPVRVTVTWSTHGAGGPQPRSMSAVTLVYPKG